MQKRNLYIICKYITPHVITIVDKLNMTFIYLAITGPIRKLTVVTESDVGTRYTRTRHE